MFLFDTNHFGLLAAGETNTLRRVQQHADETWLSSVAAEELLIGRMSTINRARAPRTSLSIVRAHEEFAKSVEDLRLLPLFIYSVEAERVYQTLPAAARRVGSQDCRIAAQAIAHGLTVVTRNLRDFVAIGAPCVDWSA